MNKQFLLNIVYILLGSALLGISYNIISPSGIPLIAEKTQLIKTGLDDFITSPNNSEENTAREIDLKTAFEIHQKDLAIFVDGRDEWEYGEGRIAGAINMPDYNFEDHIDEYNSMDKNLNYIVYCGGDDCDISIRLAKKMKELGFTNVYVFSGGWDQWFAANFPVDND